MVQVLKQKKLYEGQRSTLYNQQFNVEQTRFNFESMNDTVQTVQASAGALRQLRAGRVWWRAGWLAGWLAGCDCGRTA
jgi:hypothetical protein